MIVHTDGLKFSGRCILRAWPAGYVKGMIDAGISPRQIVNQRLLIPICVIPVNNMIVDVGRGLVGDFLIGAVTVGLTYHAIGLSATPPANADTILGSEYGRKTLVSSTRAGNIVTLNAFYLGVESNVLIEEAGVIGGPAASITPNTGTLFSHFLIPYDNTGPSPSDLTFEYSLTLT